MWGFKRPTCDISNEMSWSLMQIGQANPGEVIDFIVNPIQWKGLTMQIELLLAADPDQIV
jgi:hypothetical protein